MEKVSVIVCSTELPEEKFFEGLEENASYIREVVIPFELKVDTGIHTLCLQEELKGKSLTKSELRNELTSRASSENILYLSSSTILEEDFIAELLEERNATSADIVFANPIYSFEGKEEVKNLEQTFGNEKALLSSLAVEDHIPEWGILTTKSVIERGGGFDPFLEDYEFYDFIYRNISWLKLRLSELTYFTQEIKETFIDTAWRSYVLRKMLKNFDWKEDIFPYLSWDEKPEVAKATALTLIGDRLSSYFDFLNASNCYREALLHFHNQETLRRLVDSFKNMGFFDKAREILSPEQGISKDVLERELELVNNLEKAIRELEQAVEEGKVVEALAAATEFAEVYSGAPIYNIFGVINWIKKDMENAYQFFYKAVTMNPLNKDFCFNLTSVARDLGKEKNVEKLYSILLSS